MPSNKSCNEQFSAMATSYKKAVLADFSPRSIQPI